MCEPEFYGIEYEINPWMQRSRPADRELAQAQWRALHDLLVSCCASIERLPPVRGLPDLVFTANAALVFRQRAYLAQFKPQQRRGEELHAAVWLREAGFSINQLPPDAWFEGAGDGLFCGETLFTGYRQRSTAWAGQWLGKQLGCRTIPLELVDPYYYHLDTCFCPLSHDAALYYPPAFDVYGQQALAAHIPRLVAVTPEEARRFACNAVVVGRNVVLNAGCPLLEAQLAELGFIPHATPLDEFVKAGGSAKCLTLRLDGEDAAAWRSKEPANQ